MRTWLNKDGKYVSEEPDVYVVGIDYYGNTIFNVDDVESHYRYPRCVEPIRILSGEQVWYYLCGKPGRYSPYYKFIKINQ